MKYITVTALIVLFGFFSVGIPIATLPGLIKGTLGLSDVWLGIILGTQSLVTLVSRHHSGSLSDLKGPKVAVLRGLFFGVISGIVGLGIVYFQGVLGLVFLLVGRIILGYSESLLITGALSWGVGLVGPSNAGRVMAWSGMAMYAAIAISSPLGYLMVLQFGFQGGVVLAILFPIFAGIISYFVPAVPPVGSARIPFYQVVPKVWKQGMGLFFAAVCFAGIAGFSTLLFKERGWENAHWVMVIFGSAYVLARIFFAQTVDQYGGKRIALIFSAVAILGQGLLWQANHSSLVFLGAALTGFGYSLVFPAFGVEAVKNMEAKFRGVALGAYVAFFDLALGVTGPLAGFVAKQFGYAAVYAFGMIACTLSFLIALSLKEIKKITEA
ncbi:putative MFS family arabinose efflux permease [Leptospira meyeri]|uniref:Putative MFS family arabinose efflux permease n=1 Tax=Leptospira meyeri TaxID=29508 RepID=A0A4R8MSB2_LEPME|nr:MFS transporter [Leptospira meyeri]EKJ87613.1 transporter, major facilitator family protein [Leptospira meyeri serovar Hardjo str. Went 5]TDY68009.1 putative MFS family arabinose efflux permease [Leptospira meyeri]TGL51938.1 MFS transporter [Leptospira meyeri]